MPITTLTIERSKRGPRAKTRPVGWSVIAVAPPENR